MVVSFNYSKLNGKITEVFGSQQNLATQLLVDRSTLNKKLNNRVPFSQTEIFTLCDLLGIPLKKIPEYFFCRQ